MSRRPDFSRSVSFMLFAGALLLLGLVLAALHFATQARHSSRESLYAAQLNGRLLRLFSLIQDAESSQRGYLLTGEDLYLGPFKRSNALVSLQFTGVLSDLPRVGVAKITSDRLGVLMRSKMGELRRAVDLRRSGRPVEAHTLLRTGVGKRAMDEIRQIMTRIEAITESFGAERLVALQDASRRLIVSIAGGAVLLLFLVGGSIALVIAHARQLEAARLALARQNETLESKVRERTRFLERANTELQSYAYIVGHDLRAPLVNIMGFTAELERAFRTLTGYLDAHPPGDEGTAREIALAVHDDIPEALTFIRSSMKRMDDLINEILKLARAGSRHLQPEPLRLSAVIEEALENVQHRIEEDGAVVTIAPTLPEIVSDRLALQQIFGNLLDNAIKYADPSRSVIIQISGAVSGEYAVITVQDNGRGIAEGDRERIFELFRRSGPQDRPGEGIGLAHVRALVRRLGGDVVVRSTLGEGTSFTVTVAADLRRAKPRGPQ